MLPIGHSQSKQRRIFVGFLGSEGVVGSKGLRLGQKVEQGRFSDVGEAQNSNGQMVLETTQSHVLLIGHGARGSGLLGSHIKQLLLRERTEKSRQQSPPAFSSYLSVGTLFFVLQSCFELCRYMYLLSRQKSSTPISSRINQAPQVTKNSEN